MVLCGIGYVNLGVFAVSSMTRTLILLGYVVGLRVLFYQGLRVATSPENALGGWLRRRLVLDDGGAARLVFWVMLAVDVLGATLLVATIAIMWGLPGAALDQVTDLAINGVDVGGFNLSLVNIAVAVGVFVALLTAVRIFQRFLADRVLVQTRLELGVRDALATGVSYVGYVLAALITFGILGLDVSNVALIFGALSVGIGFGLQHVVSNFVSGLILLVQRPIKTGDWIVVGDQQGYVRRISVISTEIQTFDAAAVIVPNSTMLSSQVINWHLHNKLGRVIVRVGVVVRCRSRAGAKGTARLRRAECRPAQAPRPAGDLPGVRRKLARVRAALLPARDRRAAAREQRPALRDQEGFRRGRDRDPLPATRPAHSWRRPAGDARPGRGCRAVAGRAGKRPGCSTPPTGHAMRSA